MDIRRFHSSPLVDSDSKTSGKLPLLWRTLKSKLDSLGAGRKCTNTLDSRPGRNSGPDSPPDSPAGLPFPASHFTAALSATHASQDAGLQRGSPIARIHSVTPGLQRFGKQQQLPLCGLTATLRSSSGVSASKPLAVPSEASSSSPLGQISLDNTSSSNSSYFSSEPLSGPLPTLPAIHNTSTRTASRSSRAQVETLEGGPAAAQSAHSTGRKLLGVSPVLPIEMRRPVWSLDDFIISKRLHKSSSSAVYRAVCRRSGTPVALKVYFLSKVASNVLHMLKREIDIHAVLVHKHIARLYAAFLDEGNRVVLVQEFAAQGDLYGVLQRLGGRMPPEQVADGVMRPFLDALSYMHSKGICHRDIKPENILYNQSWRLLVADFGVSINLHQERAVTRAGTEGYMAPEVERCPLKTEPHENKDNPRYAYSAAVDIWAVGVLAYELMVGFPPVVSISAPSGPAPPPAPGAAADSLGGFVRSHMTASSLHFPASVPPAARAFVLAALSPDPLERPTATQLLLHPWLQQQRLPGPAGAAAAMAAPLPVARAAWEALSPAPRNT